MAEIDLVRELMVVASLRGDRLWRNNSGVGWAGHLVKTRRMQAVMIGESDVVIRGARPLHAGLSPGSSDLIGLHVLTVTPEMVGRRIAVFTAVECKADTALSATQAAFLDTVRSLGGIGMVAKSVEDLEKGLR